MSRVEYFAPADQPPPKGHYSPAAGYGDLVFVSGQLPARDEHGRPAEAFGEQVRSVMQNLFAVLRSAGSGPADLLKVTAYIVGVEHWDEFNAVYAELMGEAKPARAVVPVPELHFGCLVEVEAVAVK